MPENLDLCTVVPDRSPYQGPTRGGPYNHK